MTQSHTSFLTQRPHKIFTAVRSATKMALLFTSQHSSLFTQNPSQSSPFPSIFSPATPTSLSLHPTNHRSRALRFRLLRLRSSISGDDFDPVPGDNPVGGEDSSGGGPAKITDEWGEAAEPEASYTKLSESDPPKDEDEDEWGGDGYVGIDNGSAAKVGDETREVVDEKLNDLKRCLVDTVYGTGLGFRAGLEVRAEVLELVNQLEAANPIAAPTQAPELLDGNWVLL